MGPIKALVALEGVRAMFRLGNQDPNNLNENEWIFLGTVMKRDIGYGSKLTLDDYIELEREEEGLT